jgi:6-pyruvoyltetrahydropterin/6-carboxytetrahydropterin synthase
MTSVTITVDFCYGHRLLDYDGKCAHLHGHNGRVEVCVHGVTDKLNRSGFVIDFSDIKAFVKSWIDEEWDHRMQLRSDDPVIGGIREHDDKVRVVGFNPTAENMARELFAVVGTFLSGVPEAVNVTSVKFWETPTSFAEVTL